MGATRVPRRRTKYIGLSFGEESEPGLEVVVARGARDVERVPALAVGLLHICAQFHEFRRDP